MHHISRSLYGLKTVRDIFNTETNNFKSINEVNQIVEHPIGIHIYNQIKSAVNKKWGNLLRNEIFIQLDNLPYIRRPNIVYVNRWTSQILYLKMLEKISSPPTALDKWPLENRILLDLTEQNYRLTNDTKILDTQLRINNRFYHTTKQLCHKLNHGYRLADIFPKNKHLQSGYFNTFF